MRTYARKVRSDERWSRATEPVFRNTSEMRNGIGSTPAATAAGTAPLSTAFDAEEEEDAAAEGPSQSRSRWSWSWPTTSGLKRKWGGPWRGRVSRTSSSPSSSSSEFGGLPSRDASTGEEGDLASRGSEFGGSEDVVVEGSIGSKNGLVCAPSSWYQIPRWRSNSSPAVSEIYNRVRQVPKRIRYSSVSHRRRTDAPGAYNL